MRKSFRIMIPVMFPPYEDEHISSWFIRLAEANGMNLGVFRETYLCPLDGRGKGLFWYEKGICDFPDADVLILRHTQIPFLVPRYGLSGSYTVSTVAGMLQATMYNCREPLYDIPYDLEPTQGRFCLQCMMDDAENGRQAYMRVWHQLPGVKVCAIHGCSLMETNETRNGIVYRTLSTDKRDKEKDLAHAVKARKVYRHGIALQPVKAHGLSGIVPLETDSVLLYAQCPECGERFLTTIYACTKGRGCPVCDRGKDMAAEGMKMLPEYRIRYKNRDMGTRHNIIHRCGRVLTCSISEVLWEGSRCMCGKGGEACQASV